jgi:glyoxylase-like metal-dependent hydrolase (beta-lactamase superfamily II)
MVANEPYTFQLGAFTCTVFHDENQTLTASQAFEGAPESEWQAAVEKGGYDAIDLSYNVLMVDTGTQKILVDAGNSPQYDGRLLALMQDMSIKPEAIDAVILSHAHADHYAGMLNADGSKAFPHAAYLVWRDEWEYYTSEAGMEHERQRPSGEERIRLIQNHLLPLKPYLTLIDKNTPQIAPGIRVIPAFGHSKYHLAVEIESGGECLLCTGDAFVHPLHLENPHWSFRNDFDVKQTAATRVKLLEYALVKNAKLFSYHFTFPGLGTVDRNGEGHYHWRECRQSLKASGYKKPEACSKQAQQPEGFQPPA